MPPITLNHPIFGSIRCTHDPSTSLITIHSLPYATIPQRFARSHLCSYLASHPSSISRLKDGIFDATAPGPTSIQPFGSVKSDASNIPLPIESLPDDEEQSEDCLTLSIYIPSSALDSNSQTFIRNEKLPVLLFIHGGAFFLGSSTRPYYSPVSLLSHSISTLKPIIFISINYRLGALGFLHAQTPSGLAPPNNGLHDQLRALEWVHRFVGGFGGDPDNVTALGQSAGGESLSILSHADLVQEKKLLKRVIMMSGSPVTMPALTPVEHDENFLEQARKVGISTDGKGVENVVRDLITAPVEKIRELEWVGLPCTQTDLLPFERPSMGMMRAGGPAAWRNKKIGVEKAVIGSTTYDGGISFNMLSRDSSRSSHASAFINIAHDVLGAEHASRLCDIYAIDAELDDDDALQRICLFESDIGFFFAALSVAQSSLIPSPYFQIFDLPNPFDGPLKSMGEYATHTFDITTLLGGYDESLAPDGYADVVADWRSKILDFVREGKAPCWEYSEGEGEGGNALVVGRDGVKEVGRDEYMSGRRHELMDLADEIDGEDGWDVLWVDVCRRFLMKGD
jgi:carboxylesterase type B